MEFPQTVYVKWESSNDFPAIGRWIVAIRLDGFGDGDGIGVYSLAESRRMSIKRELVAEEVGAIDGN